MSKNSTLDCKLYFLLLPTLDSTSPISFVVPLCAYHRLRMEAVYAWVKGAKFVEVQKLTGFFEGSTIRALRRLEELLRQLASASKAIGNLELQAKFEKGSDLLKRDIVFCSSLYL